MSDIQSLWTQIQPKFFDGLTLVAIVATIKFLMEYMRDNRRKRLELYMKLRDEFRTNPNFSDIFERLVKYDEAVDNALKIKIAETLESIKARYAIGIRCILGRCCDDNEGWRA